MTNYLIASLISVSLLSCGNNKVGTPVITKIDTFKIENKNLPVDKITFDFAISKKAKKNRMIKINTTFFNSYKDTVYFLTWTCDGLVNDIVYDTAKMALFPHYSCNASFPMIGKIPPNDKLDFDANFILKTDDKKMKLSYDFYRVESDFDIKADIHKIIKYQDDRQKTILNAKEHSFE